MTEYNLPKDHIVQEAEWYRYDNKLFTRVIVTMNPQDNNSTMMIILDEPTVKEYLIHNLTDQNIEFQKYDHK